MALKRIASTICDWKESFDRDDMKTLMKQVNDTESESMELDILTGDSKCLARGPASFFENLPDGIGDFLMDNGHMENTFWDTDLLRLMLFWKGYFMTWEDFEKMTNEIYQDQVKANEYEEDTEKAEHTTATPMSIANYPNNVKAHQVDDLFEGHDDYS